MLESIGERIRSVRRSKGIERRRLADLGGCSLPELTAIEDGRAEPSLSLLRRLALGLRVRAGDLLDGVDSDRDDPLTTYLALTDDWTGDDAAALKADIEAVVRLYRARRNAPRSTRSSG